MQPVRMSFLSWYETLSSFVRRKIAWSKLGCVAAIAADGRAVKVRILIRDHNNGTWTLSQESRIEQVTIAHGGQQLSHLSWSPSGVELAVVDTLGRISIFQMINAMNRYIQSRSTKSDHEDDLGVMIGMTWLTVERQVGAPFTGVFHRLRCIRVSLVSISHQE